MKGCGEMFFDKRISRTNICNEYHYCDKCKIKNNALHAKEER